VRGLETCPRRVRRRRRLAALKVKAAASSRPTPWIRRLPEVWGHDWRRGGSDDLFAELDADSVILEDGSPIAAKVEAGDTISVTSQSGEKAKLTVLGFYRDQMAYTGMMVSLDTLEKLDVRPRPA